MKRLLQICLALVLTFVATHARTYNETCDIEEHPCLGEGVESRCVDGRCVCLRGFYPRYDGSCASCPGAGQLCFQSCCSRSADNLHCWQGVCQVCHDSAGNWVCGENINQIMLVSATQIAMGTALVLAIVATFVLLYKLCYTADVRTLGGRTRSGARLSVGSMQLYVDERLRDPPPRYSRPAPAGAAPVCPLHGYQNAGFIHDSSAPPPPYAAAAAASVAAAAPAAPQKEDPPPAVPVQTPPPTLHM